MNALEKLAGWPAIPVTVDTHPIPWAEPLSTFLALREAMGEDEVFVLESLGGSPRDPRRSFVGFRPLLTVRVSGETLSLGGHDALLGRIRQRVCATGAVAEVGDRLRLRSRAKLWEVLRAIGSAFDRSGGAPKDARGFGFFGYFGYDTAWAIERLPTRIEARPPFPDVSLSIYQGVIEHDLATRTSRLVLATGDGWGGPSAAEVHELVAGAPPELPPEALAEVHPPSAVSGSVRREDYLRNVERALHHIRIGDIYQVQLGNQLEIVSGTSPLDVYRRLRARNPSPYMYLVPCGGFRLVGASPELFIRIEEGLVTMRPIAGTIRRGATEGEDRAAVETLRNDPKELAEHRMLVDLCRNDIGRICAPGTLREEELMVVERYSHVHHLVSTISGVLDQRLDPYDAIRATFPAGTMTGAPKIRAMEIIEEAENTRRGPYAGALGFLDFSGYTNLALCIRTAIHQGDRYYVRASAGVVADSDPQKEWNETRQKMAALYWAISGEELLNARVGH